MDLDKVWSHELHAFVSRAEAVDALVARAERFEEKALEANSAAGVAFAERLLDKAIALQA